MAQKKIEKDFYQKANVKNSNLLMSVYILSGGQGNPSQLWTPYYWTFPFFVFFCYGNDYRMDQESKNWFRFPHIEKLVPLSL